MAEIPAGLLAFIRQPQQAMPSIASLIPKSAGRRPDPTVAQRAKQAYEQQQAEQAAAMFENIAGQQGQAEQIGELNEDIGGYDYTPKQQATGLFSDDPQRFTTAASEMIKSGNPMLQKQGMGMLDRTQISAIDSANPQLNKPQFGGQVMMKDSTDRLFMGTSIRNADGTIDPSMVAVDGSGAKPEGSVEMVGSFGLTAGQTVEQKGKEKQVQMRVAAHQKGIDDLTGQLTGMDEQDRVFSEAENLLTTGNPSTGTIQNMFPSFTADTIRLQNIANRAGLSIIQSTTFGALSAGEMKLAMQTGMPTNLTQPELLKWVQDTRSAKKKLKAELINAISFMNSRDPTKEGYKNSQVEWQKARNQQITDEKEQSKTMSIDELVNKYAD